MSASLARLRSSGSTRILKLFSSSVLDQVVLSLASFAVGFILIRMTTDEDYGIYVLVLTAQQLMTSLQRAWLNGPMVIVVSRKTPEDRRRSVSAVKDSQRRTLLRVLPLAQLVPLGGYLLGLLSWKIALLLAIAGVSIWATLRREFLRDILLQFSRPQSLLLADVIFAVLLILGVCAAITSHGAAVLWAVGTLTAAALVGDAIANRMLAKNPGWISGDAGPVLREMRPLGIWATAGALNAWLIAYASNYLLAGLVDLKAVADVNATRLLLMPVIMLTVGVQALMIPISTNWNAEVGLARLTRRLIAFALGMLLLDFIYMAVVWIFRDWLIGSFLHKQIDHSDALLLLWTGVATAGVLRDVIGLALFASGRLKSLAWQAVLCAVVSLCITLVGVRWWGAAAGLIGQIAGELINLIGIGLLLREALRRPDTSSVKASEDARAT
jgi:O-antigen/teichoic acid export membrane protein